MFNLDVRNINLAVHGLSCNIQELSLVCLKGTAVAAAALAFLSMGYLIKGSLLSIITLGRFTLLGTAILTSPYVWPLFILAVKITILTGFIFGLLFAFSSLTASLTRRWIQAQHP